MRRLALLFALLSVLGCKKKAAATSDASSLAQIFGDSPDAAASADPSASAVASSDEPLPSLKHVDVPPPVIAGKPKPSASSSVAASAAPAGNPNLPQCIVARAFCGQNKPECEAKKAACIAAGGRM